MLFRSGYETGCCVPCSLRRAVRIFAFSQTDPFRFRDGTADDTDGQLSYFPLFSSYSVDTDLDVDNVTLEGVPSLLSASQSR